MARGKSQQNVNGLTSAVSTADTSARPFGLIDVESGNMVGSFPSERDALMAVAATAREYGADSDAVLSLSLFRDDVPAERGFIADGEELVHRALTAADTSQSVAQAPPDGARRGPVR